MDIKRIFFKKFIEPFFKDEINKIDKVLEHTPKIDYKEIIKTNESKEFFKDKSLYSTGEAKEQNKKLGKWSYFFKNSENLEKIILYSRNNHEVIKEFYLNGALKMEIVEEENLKNRLTYFKTGELKQVEILLDSLLEDKKYVYSFFKSGTLKEKYCLINEKLEGIKEIYNEDAFLINKTYYEMGTRSGAEKKYYDNGLIKSEIDYKKGKKIGTEKHYYDNGQLKIYGYNKNGNFNSLGKFKENGFI